jgi:hypothetical protein
MPVPRPTAARRAATLAVVAGTSLLASAGTALGMGAPLGLASTPASPSRELTWTFGWGAPAPDPGYVVTSYERSVDGGGFVDTNGATSFSTLLAEGNHTIQVRAIESAVATDPPADPAPPSPLPGDTAQITVRVDRTAPRIAAALSPASPNGGGGWYRSLRVVFTCSDNGFPVTCPPAITIGDRGAPDQGPNQARSGTATDGAGNQASATSPRFNFDAIGPRTGEPQTPSPNARVGVEPTFTWSSGGDATSGAQRYDVLASWSGRAEHVIASVPHQPGRSSFSSARQATLPNNPAFPERAVITWRIRTYDVGGNSTTSFSRNFTLDSAVPPAPAITGGPSGFTNRNAPTFPGRGGGGGFLGAAGGAGPHTPVQTGQGGTSVTLAPLADGDYTFQVTQTTASGVPSDEATRTFQVDTTPPAAPQITSRPPFPTAVTQPSFAWTSEEASTFRWQVLAGTTSLQGPNDTLLPQATTGTLSAGGYTFRVWQIDPAGNVSAPTAEAFQIVGATGAAQRTGARFALPQSNAGKLRPRAGAVVRTRTPVLSWVKGPKGTTLYNLQLFRVVRRPVGKPSVVTKVLTAFPRKRTFTLPAAKVKPSACYVWRIWPYRGDKFAPKPLGISNFCVAKASVLKAAARAKARAHTAGNRATAAAARRPADR